MKRDVYPVKVIKILPVPPDGPKPPFLKNPHRLAGLYANVRGAALRVVLGIRSIAGAWAVQGENAARTVWLAAAGRYRGAVARLKQPGRLQSSKDIVQGSARSESIGGHAVGRARTRARAMRQKVQPPWAITASWTAARIGMASRLRAWRQTLRQRMHAFEKMIADRRRRLVQGPPVHEATGPAESRNPSRSESADMTHEGPPQTRHPEFAELAAELAAVKADVAKHKEVIDDLTRKLTAAQGRGGQPASSALGPTVTPPAPKPPLPTKRNGHGEAKFHRS